MFYIVRLLVDFIGLLCKELWVDDLCKRCEDCCAASALCEHIIIIVLLYDYYISLCSLYMYATIILYHITLQGGVGGRPVQQMQGLLCRLCPVRVYQ